MTPIQQLMLGAGGAAKKTYMDEVFSTDVWSGDGASHQVVNNIDVSGEGGMVWTKCRSHQHTHCIVDTVRGANKTLFSSASDSEETGTDYFSSLNNNGFSTGSWDGVNGNGKTFAGWTFRKAKGFFDVVTYSGTGSKRTVSHSLGCKPGMIMIKRTDQAGDDWDVWMEAAGPQSGGDWSHLRLNSDNFATTTSRFGIEGTDDPTSTTFTVKDQSGVNASGGTYVAYVFAGGKSTAATARSVDFDGTGDYLSLSSSSDFAFGTGDFTWEAWIKPTNWTNSTIPIFSCSDGGGFWVGKHSSEIRVLAYNGGALLQTSTFPPIGQWTHVAVTRSGTSLKLFYNGTLIASSTSSHSFVSSSNNVNIAIDSTSYNNHFTGSISNLRVVKGTAVYTSSFKPPTEPLTNITNTKLLCCNNSSTTGSTVTPGTITANGDPTASTDSPFDDPAGFKFGENGDQGIIKCGSYVGNGSTTGPEINLGWEPQLVMVKNVSQNAHWVMMDSMRGIVTSGNDGKLYPSSNSGEDSGNIIDLTPVGFTIPDNSGNINTNGDTYIYLAIRRPDGYVGKPAEAGTDVFAMDMGSGSSTIPNYDSGFPVDFAIYSQPAATDTRWTTARLIGTNELKANDTNAESSYAANTWDSNVGWNQNGNSSHQSWMWKRHAGFDVVTWNGDGVSGRQMPHSLGKIPQMIWVKRRNSSDDWKVYHKDLNGGSSPEDEHLVLNSNAAEVNSADIWNDTAPTSTHFTLGNDGTVNSGGTTRYIAMLFASVDGISKVGSYTGVSGQLQLRNLGFTPRFLLVKRVDGTGNWVVFDTNRGWGSGDDKKIYLNSTAAQTTQDVGDPVSSGGGGFDLYTGNDDFNNTGNEYIYYAHA